MKFIRHPSNNIILNAPEGMEDCDALHATKVEIEGDPYIVSFWMPSADELAGLMEGKPIRMWVAGSTCPPIALDVDVQVFKLNKD